MHAILDKWWVLKSSENLLLIYPLISQANRTSLPELQLVWTTCMSCFWWINAFLTFTIQFFSHLDQSTLCVVNDTCQNSSFAPRTMFFWHDKAIINICADGDMISPEDDLPLSHASLLIFLQVKEIFPSKMTFQTLVLCLACAGLGKANGKLDLLKSAWKWLGNWLLRLQQSEAKVGEMLIAGATCHTLNSWGIGMELAGVAQDLLEQHLEMGGIGSIPYLQWHWTLLFTSVHNFHQQIIPLGTDLSFSFPPSQIHCKLWSYTVQKFSLAHFAAQFSENSLMCTSFIHSIFL